MQHCLMPLHAANNHNLQEIDSDDSLPANLLSENNN